MSINLRPLSIFPITTRFLQVLRTDDVTPGMRRVTLGGEQLKAHTAANGFPVAEFRSDGFDDEFKILLRHPDAEEAIGPTQADGVLDWPRGNDHLVMRTYTVRRWDAEKGELDVDFVVHGLGPATTWARTVQVGATIQIAGPKSSATHPEGADWVLVAGDETALPAIGRWLEEWPKNARGQVFIEVAHDEHRQLDLPTPEGVEVHWLVNNGAEAGTTTLLFDAILSAPWWEGTAFAWVAGEANTLKPIRRWLKNEKGLSKEQIEVTGYWKRQEVVVSEEHDGIQDLSATKNIREEFHELTDLTAGFALRVAATIGLGQAFGGHVRTIGDLVAATGSNRIGLSKLLHYLRSIDIVEEVEGGYQLTDLGRELDDDRVSDSLSMVRSHAHRELAGLLGLLEAVQTGEPSGYEESDELRATRLDDESSLAGYYAAALAPLPVFEEVSSMAVIGRAPEVFGTVIAEKHPNVTLSYELNENVDLVLLIDPLSTLSDEDAATLLRHAAACGRVILFTDVLDHATAHDHDYEHDLEHFSLTGGGLRTNEEYEALFNAAGIPQPQRSTVGWGKTVFDFSKEINSPE
ncbi:siderophore-interacting protein [Corynebacterium suranareeae]|uniref:Siderophore-interacting protein n=1 Tax=Corynebacterium suranareeae TaxID=2506452 RepID=A0A160PNF9_9CORY|nr:siderophore-interacting protein [Corynebacterium suranareeae]BAU94904.1 siderophore-interacting protein [Corynebacterium suranareeae]